eukprot:TRINITY_DN28385_c0_g1_i1.p1 TRINITY_DN28385_c0_g1~~TRINITY_DN28385_c0_g1_i1.p1  ORF type:complete len:517 (+),score=165.06 TRINITY_DN28385_c0_g1_i1:39-1553(+)
MAITRLRRPPVSLLLMWYFGMDAIMAFFNWWFCISVQMRPLSPTSSDLHCFLSVLGFFVFALFSSPMLYYPHYYRDRLRQWDLLVNKPNKRHNKGLRVWRRKTLWGVYTQFLVSLPRFIVEFHLTYTYGWLCILQSMCMFVTFGTVLLGFLAVWAGYLWRMSKLFQKWSLNSMRQEERTAYLEVYKRGTYVMKNDEATGMPWVDGLGFPSFIANPTLFYYFHPDDHHVMKDMGRNGEVAVVGHVDTAEVAEANPNRNLAGLHFVPVIAERDDVPTAIPEGCLSIIGPDAGFELSPAVGRSPGPPEKVKICVLGSGAVGKSAMSIKFIQGRFFEKYDPTIVDTFVKPKEVDGEVVVLEITATSGQDGHTGIFQKADGFLAVYSVADRISYTEVMSMRDDVLAERDYRPCPIVLCGNKSDLPESMRNVTQQEGEDLALSWAGEAAPPVPFFETSARNGANIAEAFHQVVREVRRRRLATAANALILSPNTTFASVPDRSFPVTPAR